MSFRCQGMIPLGKVIERSIDLQKRYEFEKQRKKLRGRTRIDPEGDWINREDVQIPDVSRIARAHEERSIKVWG